MKNLKLTFIADTHHFSKTLGARGYAYDMRSGSDQKCLAETGDIIDCAFEKLANSDTDAVLIAGDLTNDGEVVSHEEFREKLYILQEKKPVFVITATHDWCCDENPRRFCGNRVTHDVEVMPSDKLRDFYADFGPGKAISEYRTHLGTSSYVAELGNNVRILALNDDQNGKGKAGFKEEHFQWIEKQIKKANDDGCLIIGMEHHLLMPHINSLITGGCCVGDREIVASRLADAGLKYMFVGHSHIQRTDLFKSPSGNTITEVNIGSLCGYPAPMVNVIVNNDKTLSYNVEHLDKLLLDGKEVDAQEFLKEHAKLLVHRLLNSENKKDFSEKLTALQLNGDKLSNLWFVAKPVIKNINSDSVFSIYRRLKHLGLAKNIDKSYVMEYKDKKLIDIIDEVMFAFMDGSINKYSKDDDYYKLIMSVIEIPAKVFKKNIDAKKLIFTFDEILTGGKIDNQNATI